MILEIATAMIVITAFIGVLKAKQYNCTSNWCNIPFTFITSPLNVTIHAFTTPIKAFVPYNCNGYLAIKSI